MKLKIHSITAAIVLVLILTAPSLRAEGQADNTPGTRLGARNLDGASETYGEVTETVPQEGAPDSGGSPSQEHPSVTASDPSMWEEQPHWDCNTKPGKGPDDPLGCVLGRRMTIPQDDTTDASGGSGPRTITTRQAATLIAQGSGITRQPPGPKVIISMAFIVYTNPTPRYQTTTILGTPIEVEFTPTSYTWGWGDGTTTTTTDPGAPYPNQTVTHHYQHTATGVTTTLTTTWTTRYRPEGENQWRPIEGTITTTETSTPYDLVRVVTYLTDDAEEAQGH
ncbi:zinc transporter [Actinomyces oris]|uniref:zinc transporter n=1 Tax=Actinomyces oris TaxID=544580 RepID=UPI000A976091